jgi:CPA2 family monovalent cation:H+ antiporter-2
VASTVVVLRSFEGPGEMRSDVGRIAIGWLVVQDLLVILGLVLLPPLLKGGLSPGALALGAGWQIVKVAVFVAVMLLVGGRAFPWLLVRVAHTRSRELFTLSVLSIALGIAWLANAVFGASFALGAFVAGLVLNGSKLGHNAAERALPFRDAFAVLFFVSVGMLFDPRILLREPLALAGVLGVVLLSGAAAGFGVARLAKLGRADTAHLASALPQIGEFSFLLAAICVSLGAMARATQGLVIAAAILSIVVNPLVAHLAGRLGRAGRPAG